MGSRGQGWGLRPHAGRHPHGQGNPGAAVACIIGREGGFGEVQHVRAGTRARTFEGARREGVLPGLLAHHHAAPVRLVAAGADESGAAGQRVLAVRCKPNKSAKPICRLGRQAQPQQHAGLAGARISLEERIQVRHMGLLHSLEAERRQWVSRPQKGGSRAAPSLSWASLGGTSARQARLPAREYSRVVS